MNLFSKKLASTSEYPNLGLVEDVPAVHISTIPITTSKESSKEYSKVKEMILFYVKDYSIEFLIIFSIVFFVDFGPTLAAELANSGVDVNTIIAGGEMPALSGLLLVVVKAMLETASKVFRKIMK